MRDVGAIDPSGVVYQAFREVDLRTTGHSLDQRRCAGFARYLRYCGSDLVVSFVM